MAAESSSAAFPGWQMDEVRLLISGHFSIVVDRFISFNIFVWAVALLCHAAAKNFGALFACRALLGICESVITPGYLLVTSMFYTRKEQSQRVGYWCRYLNLSLDYALIIFLGIMNGVEIILLALIGFGCLHIKSTTFMAWQWFVSYCRVTDIFSLLLQADHNLWTHHSRRLCPFLVLLP